jgi:hypothetical protein
MQTQDHPATHLQVQLGDGIMLLHELGTANQLYGRCLQLLNQLFSLKRCEQRLCAGTARWEAAVRMLPCQATDRKSWPLAAMLTVLCCGPFS